MPTFTVGPNSDFPSIASAMGSLAVGANDTLLLETGYGNETAVVTHNDMTISGGATSTGVVVTLGSGVTTFSLSGAAPIGVHDSIDPNTISGNDGDNVIQVSAGADVVSGGLGSDRLVVDYALATDAVTGTSVSNFAEAGVSGRLVTINGGFEHFTILTGAGADTITTGGGDDVIITGEGASTVTAGAGANFVDGGSNADTVTALDGGNYIDGHDGANNITSGDGADVIKTGVGADTIVGGGGDDLITVRGGIDIVDNGAGADRLIVDYSALTTDVSGGTSGGDVLAGYSGAISDGPVNRVDFQGAENFTITTGSGNDFVVTGDGADLLASGAGSDLLDAGGGADTLNGGAGIDAVFGGAGDDLIYVNDAADTVSEAIGGGSDIVAASASYALASGVAVENLRTTSSLGTMAIDLTGNEFRNSLIGNSGDNVLDGGAGEDTMRGGAGDDTYFVDKATDRVLEAAGAGTDVVAARTSYTLDAGAQVETLRTTNNAGTAAIDLTGNDFANRVNGNAGGNTLSGAGGGDVLSGLDGADVLIGGAGNDTLYGGNGADVFVFDQPLGAFDRIMDFETADTIRLSQSVYAAAGAPGTLSTDAFYAGPSAHDATDRIIYDGGTGKLFYDEDGAGGADGSLIAVLKTGLTLTADDFTVA